MIGEQAWVPSFALAGPGGDVPLEPQRNAGSQFAQLDAHNVEETTFTATVTVPELRFVEEVFSTVPAN